MKMKKGLAAWLALVLLTLGSLPAAAAEACRLDEPDVRFALPDGYAAITRDTQPDDPVFDRLGLDGPELLEFMQTNNIYLDAFLETDLMQELTVTMTAQPGQEDFARMEDEELSTLIDTYMPHYQSGGVLADGYQIYQHPQAKFVVLEFYNMVDDACGLQFYTVKDEKAMNFTMHGAGQELGEDQKAAMNALMSGLEFYAEAEPFTYTDDENGLTFTVPAGWEEREAPEGLKLLLASQEEGGQTISYGSMDLYGQLTDADKKKYDRSDMDNSYYTRAEAADMLGAAEDEVEDAVYNGVTYFRAQRPGTGTASQKDVIQLICIEDGWMHLFTFGGTSDSASYDDFTSLLESAEYTDAGGVLSEERGTSGDASPLGGSIALVLLIVGAVVVVAGVLAAILVPVLVVRSRKKKAARAAAVLPPAYPGQPMPPAAPGQPDAFAPGAYPPPPAPAAQADAAQPAAPESICPACGSRMPGSSPVCPACGAGIEEQKEGR